MTGDEVFNIFRSFADESDTTFLTDAQVTSYLNQGYLEFRDLVSQIDPEIYLTRQDFVAPNVLEVDLTVVTPTGVATPIMGGTAVPGTKLQTLIRVAQVNTSATPAVLNYLDAAPNQKELPMWGYCLQGSRLMFGGTQTLNVRLEYVPLPVVAGLFAVGGGDIDDLDAFHICIALLALRYYAIRDGAASPETERQLRDKLAELTQYLTLGRSQEGSRFVIPYTWGY